MSESISKTNGRPISEVFRFCPRCGSPSSTPPGANPFRCSNNECDYIHYFSPITAVGGIVADPEGRVLLITRGREPGKGKFGLPGGFVDPCESLEEACRREVLEETNLKVTAIEYLVSFPNLYDYRGVVSNVTDGYFICDVESLDDLRIEETEVSSYEFVELAETHLRGMAFDANRKALEVYLETRD